jgi:hypothetical protein
MEASSVDLIFRIGSYFRREGEDLDVDEANNLAFVPCLFSVIQLFLKSR